MTRVALQTFGERLRHVRQRSHLSHDQLAERVGTNRSHLIKLEKNLHRPKPETVTRLAEALGIDRAELVPDGEDESEEDRVTHDLAEALAAVIRDAVQRALNSNEPTGSREEASVGSSLRQGG